VHLQNLESETLWLWNAGIFASAGPAVWPLVDTQCWFWCAEGVCTKPYEGPLVHVNTRGWQPFSHCGPISAWHYFADRPSIKYWMSCTCKFVTACKSSWHWFSERSGLASLQLDAPTCRDCGSQWHPQCAPYCQSLQSILHQLGVGSARPCNNFFTDRHQTAAQYLMLTPALSYSAISKTSRLSFGKRDLWSKIKALHAQYPCSFSSFFFCVFRELRSKIKIFRS